MKNSTIRYTELQADDLKDIRNEKSEKTRLFYFCLPDSKEHLQYQDECFNDPDFADFVNEHFQTSIVDTSSEDGIKVWSLLNAPKAYNDAYSNSFLVVHPAFEGKTAMYGAMSKEKLQKQLAHALQIMQGNGLSDLSDLFPPSGEQDEEQSRRVIILPD